MPNVKQDERLKQSIGLRVEVSEKGSGTLSYYGYVDFVRNTKLCGVTLDEAIGKNNGTIDGRQYFQCEPEHGIFVPPEKVSLTSGSPPRRTSSARPASPTKSSSSITTPTSAPRATASRTPSAPSSRVASATPSRTVSRTPSRSSISTPAARRTSSTAAVSSPVPAAAPAATPSSRPSSRPASRPVSRSASVSSISATRTTSMPRQPSASSSISTPSSSAAVAASRTISGSPVVVTKPRAVEVVHDPRPSTPTGRQLQAKSPSPPKSVGSSRDVREPESPSKVVVAPAKQLCAVCTKTVYVVEQLEVNGQKFHKTCFKCETCRKPQTPGSYVSEGAHVWCKAHYAQRAPKKVAYP